MFGYLSTRHLQKALDSLVSRIAVLEAELHRITLEWEDTKLQVRRSYQRMEKAAERLGVRENGGPAPVSPEKSPPTGSEGNSDPFASKFHALTRR